MNSDDLGQGRSRTIAALVANELYGFHVRVAEETLPPLDGFGGWVFGGDEGVGGGGGGGHAVEFFPGGINVVHDGWKCSDWSDRRWMF